MIDTRLTQPGSRPVRFYEVVDHNGRIMPHKFTSAPAAALWAQGEWPKQRQDEDRTGAGWDIQIAGAK